MGERYRRTHYHPVAKRYPAEPPPRAEMHVRRGIYDERHNGYDSDVVCDCFPRTSDLTIPSMFYDKINCPHKHLAHIQPAQETQFNYPWTADSISRRKARGGEDDELSERLSLISEEDEQLRFTPAGFINRPPADILSIATAPPYWYKREPNPRDQRPPFTAPADESDVQADRRRVVSMQDIRDPAYRTDDIHTRQRATLGGYRNSRLSNRQFTGSYVDPKDGKVYKYNVNYDGTPKPQGVRRPLPPKKPTTAQ